MYKFDNITQMHALDVACMLRKQLRFTAIRSFS